MSVCTFGTSRLLERSPRVATLAAERESGRQGDGQACNQRHLCRFCDAACAAVGVKISTLVVELLGLLVQDVVDDRTSGVPALIVENHLDALPVRQGGAAIEKTA